jgi:hypothetical protein
MHPSVRQAHRKPRLPARTQALPAASPATHHRGISSIRSLSLSETRTSLLSEDSLIVDRGGRASACPARSGHRIMSLANSLRHVCSALSLRGLTGMVCPAPDLAKDRTSPNVPVCGLEAMPSDSATMRTSDCTRRDLMINAPDSQWCGADSESGQPRDGSGVELSTHTRLSRRYSSTAPDGSVSSARGLASTFPLPRGCRWDKGLKGCVDGLLSPNPRGARFFDTRALRKRSHLHVQDAQARSGLRRPPGQRGRGQRCRMSFHSGLGRARHRADPLLFASRDRCSRATAPDERRSTHRHVDILGTPTLRRMPDRLFKRRGAGDDADIGSACSRRVSNNHHVKDLSGGLQRIGHRTDSAEMCIRLDTGQAGHVSRNAKVTEDNLEKCLRWRFSIRETKTRSLLRATTSNICNYSPSVAGALVDCLRR